MNQDLLSSLMHLHIMSDTACIELFTRINLDRVKLTGEKVSLARPTIPACQQDLPTPSPSPPRKQRPRNSTCKFQQTSGACMFGVSYVHVQAWRSSLCMQSSLLGFERLNQNHVRISHWGTPLGMVRQLQPLNDSARGQSSFAEPLSNCIQKGPAGGAYRGWPQNTLGWPT